MIIGSGMVGEDDTSYPMPRLFCKETASVYWFDKPRELKHVTSTIYRCEVGVGISKYCVTRECFLWSPPHIQTLYGWKGVLVWGYLSWGREGRLGIFDLVAWAIASLKKSYP